MGLKAPSFIQFLYKKMIEEERVQQLAREKVLELGGFLVSAKVSEQNVINVFVDKAVGISIRECLQISRYIENELDREIEDFDLSVSSPGLTNPFLVKEQKLFTPTSENQYFNWSCSKTVFASFLEIVSSSRNLMNLMTLKYLPSQKLKFSDFFPYF